MDKIKTTYILVIILSVIVSVIYLKQDNSGELELIFHNQDILPLKIDEFNTECKKIFIYECNRLAFYPDLTIDVEFRKDVGGDIRGMVYGDSTLVNKMTLYIDSSFSKEKLFGVFAHELGHMLHFSWINSSGGTMISCFDEGFASWLAGKFYLKWQKKPDFRTLDTPTDQDNYVNLEFISTFKQLSSKKRDVMYYQWACFIEYLISEFSLQYVYNFFSYLITRGVEEQILAKSLQKSMQGALLAEGKDPIDKYRTQEDIEKSMEDLQKKVAQYRQKSKKLRSEIFNTACIEIFKKDFSELKNNWLDTIAI